MKRYRFPRERLPTLYFLEEIRAISPVFLDTEIDMSGVADHRGHERRCSVVAYVLYVAARVMARHPDANAAIRGRVWPRIACYDTVNPKLTLDKAVNGKRVVLSSVIQGADRMGLDDLQARIAYLRDSEPDQIPELAGLRTLRRLPMPLGRAGFHRVVRPLGNRPHRFGTFAVTSLGHRPVDGFYSVGGTTVTLGLGRVIDRPVIRDGVVGTAPCMRLSLAFDHRVIDGVEAADVLAEIRDGLETLRFDVPAVLAPGGDPPESPAGKVLGAAGGQR